MKFSKKILVPALALAAFTAIGVGSTYAIFTSEANTNIAVTSGKVSVTATIENVKLYSGVYNDVNEAYDSVEQADKFLNGGTVSVENGVVTLNKVTPMDKVEFDVKVVNNSNVTAKYRTSVKALTDTGLMDGLNITLNGEAYNGMTSVGQWTTLEPTTTDISTMHVVVELPEAAGNEYQDKSCSIEFGVTAVQGNAHTEDVDASIDYPVYTASDLMKVAKLSETTDFHNKTVALMEDVDLAGLEWKAIGGVNSYPSKTFWGTFDGQGHTISNMTVTDTTSNYATAGLFGSVVGTVKNVTLLNPTVTSTHYAGAVVGYSSANSSTIENCHVIGGTVTTTPELIDGSYDNGDKAGGIIGYSVNGDKILNCSVEGTTIKAYRDVGGICGATNATVTGNTAKDVTVIQDNTNGYKTSVDTFGEIIGRDLGATASNNTATNVTLISNIIGISNAAELRALSAKSENGMTLKAGEKVMLLDDIDLNNEEFLPIGAEQFFNGNIDGNGHTISNLKVNKAKHAALVGNLLGTVENLTIDGATVSGADYVGAVAGMAIGTVKNCTVKNVTATATPYLDGTKYDGGAKAGAIVGYFTAQSDANLLDCYGENIVVKAYRDLGGLVGYAQGAAVVKGNTIKNVSLSYITLEAGAAYDGGTPNQNMGRFYGRYDASIVAENNTDLDA